MFGCIICHTTLIFATHITFFLTYPSDDDWFIKLQIYYLINSIFFFENKKLLLFENIKKKIEKFIYLLYEECNNKMFTLRWLFGKKWI